MKRIYSFIVGFIVLSIFTACNQSTSHKVTSETVKGDELIITAVKAVREKTTVKDDLVAKLLKEKFNIVIKTEEILQSEYINKMSLVFASDSVPDFIVTLRPEWHLDEWIRAGYLKGLTKEELNTKIPNFEKQYTSSEWESVYNNISYTDDKMYYFPGKQASLINMAWMFRKDAFLELNIEYPTTTDEMYLALKEIKNKTGKVPYVSARQPQVLWAFSGFIQSFGIPELSIRELSYEDPFTGKFIPYAFTEENYRSFLIYMNKLYKEAFIWNQFATATMEQVEKFQRQGNGYVMWAYPDKIAEYENISRSTDKNAVWDWSKDMVSKDEDKVYYKKNPYFSADGIGFNSKISDEKMAPLTNYLNWACSDEGILFHTFGVEGTTYEVLDQEPVYLDKMTNPNKATGQSMSEYGFFSWNGFITTHKSVNEGYRPVFRAMERAFMGRENYKFFSEPVMSYTEDENIKMTDIEASINDVRDEYATRFIMGQIDPNNAQDWQQYINTLGKLGLDEFKKIRVSAYNRGKN